MNEETLFHRALEQPPGARAAFLEQACAGDRALRERLEGLLLAHDHPGSFLAGPAPGPGETVVPEPVRGEGGNARNPRPLGEEPGSRIGPYKLLQQLGEGGMGSVFMAEQTAPVRRLVALKVIKPGLDSAQVSARFEAERQALALMDHPNIAKVLDAGTTDSGRPYFVMELVKGVPITTYCDQHRLTPRQRFELFLPVCRAVQHAHQKGIIHRDLKPSNVLATLYDGRPVPKVIDFGVAKATGQRLTERTLFTEFGAVVGTLEYMSPEQAELNPLDIDTRSDIYALGVLLYELLTGTTPLERPRLKGAGLLEALRLIREEETRRPSARLSTVAELPAIAAKRGTEPHKLSGLVRGELDWVVMKCLEKDRRSRYETANGLARDLERYLNDEPVQACPASAWYRFRKFTRRNRRALATAALLGVLLLAMAGILGWGARDRAARRAVLEQEVAGALKETANWYRNDKLAEAKAALKRAKGLLAGDQGSKELEEGVRRWEADLEMAARLDEIRLKRGTTRAGGFDRVGADRAYRRAFQTCGLDVEALDPDQAVRRIRASPIRDRLVAALDDWLVWKSGAKLPGQDWLVAVARRADGDRWRNRLRVAFQRWDRKALKNLADDKNVLDQPPANLVVLGVALGVTGQAPLAVKVLGRAQRLHPGDLWINFELAVQLLHLEPPRAAEAVGFFRAALGLRPGDPLVRTNLGAALERQGKLDEAEAEYRAAIAVKPDFATAHYNLGVVLAHQKRLAEAEQEFRRALRLKPNDPEGHVALGRILARRDKLNRAEAEFRKALRLFPKFARAHAALGTLYEKQGQLARAVAEFREAIRLFSDYGKRAEPEPHYQRVHERRKSYARALSGLGRVWLKQQKLAQAESALRQAAVLMPQDARAHSNFGIVLLRQGKLSRAGAAFRKAIRLEPGDPGNHVNLGNVYLRQNRLARAEAELCKALRLNRDYPLAHGELGNVRVRQNKLAEAVAKYWRALRLNPRLSRVHANLGNVLSKLGKQKEAEAALRQAVRLRPRSADFRRDLGIVLARQGRFPAAENELRAALRLRPNLPEAHRYLGNVLGEQGKLPEAVAAFQKGLQLARDDPEAHFGLAITLVKLKKPFVAETAFRKAIHLRPDFAEAHVSLGFLLYRQGKFAAALPGLRRGHALGFGRPGWRYPSAHWLRNCQRLASLDARLPEILNGQAQPTSAADRVQLAGFCQWFKKRYAAAARFYAEAFTADPLLAADLLRTEHRYNAACCAALAGCGQGRDAAGLGAKERARLRRQARAWLGADLAAWAKLLANEPATARPRVLQYLRHWLRDADLAGVRAPEALARLPKAERRRWQQLWQEVAALWVKAHNAKEQSLGR
jgi:Flp pilus assembly protein TadD/serine/threonine protein kinase